MAKYHKNHTYLAKTTKKDYKFKINCMKTIQISKNYYLEIGDLDDRKTAPITVSSLTFAITVNLDKDHIKELITHLNTLI